MNKPAGYVCSSVSDSHHTVYELLSEDLKELVFNAKRGSRLHTIGRLDCDTSGLLLFTNDGMFSHNMACPAFHIQKTYDVVLKNPVTIEKGNEYIKKVEQGMYLPEEKKGSAFVTLPAKLELCIDESDQTDISKCRITICEGKFHQVRRMFSALGNEVAQLKRISFGPYILPPSLEEGKYITFCKEEFLQP